MTKRDTSRVGKDRTDWRRHRGEAIGGKIEKRKATPEDLANWGVGISYQGTTLIETSIVRCCDEVKPGRMCPHGVWGFTKFVDESL